MDGFRVKNWLRAYQLCTERSDLSKFWAIFTYLERRKQNQNKTGRISLGLSTFHVCPIANGKVLLASSRTLLLHNVFHVNFPSFRKVAWSFHRHLYVGCPGCPVRWRAGSWFRRPQHRAQPAHQSSRAGCVCAGTHHESLEPCSWFLTPRGCSLFSLMGNFTSQKLCIYTGVKFNTGPKAWYLVRGKRRTSNIYKHTLDVYHNHMETKV